MENRKELKKRIESGELDINNVENFLSALYKGFLWDINQHLSIRGERLPHIVVNTGDATMYLNVKGQDNSKEPLEVTNEDYVYSMVPRATVQFSGVSMQTDQLTAPYTRGRFTLQTEEATYGLTAEFRRMPIKNTVSVKYRLDNFEDLLECTQQLITNLAFIKDFTITYMGHTINCTYKVPDTVDREIMLEFDGVTTDAKVRTIELEYEIETNIPIFNNRTVIFDGEIIANPVANPILKRTGQLDKENRKVQ